MEAKEAPGGGEVVTPDSISREPGRPPAGFGGRRRPAVNAGRLWAGGLATAIVAALIAVVGILIARGIFDIPVLAPKTSGTWGNANTATYALVAFCGGLVATAIMHALLLSTPSPFAFFGWIIGLSTLLAALGPFAAGGDLAPKVVTAIINALIGIGIWSLTTNTARRSLRS
jgi:Family of unknown function (DUF6069)